MKKTILTFAIALITSACYSQENLDYTYNERSRLAGLELQAYTKNHYKGIGLVLGGSAIGMIGLNKINRGRVELAELQARLSYPYGAREQEQDANRKIENGKLLSVTGLLVGLAGVCYTIEAPIHIKRAALLLSGKGVGVKVRIN